MYLPGFRLRVTRLRATGEGGGRAEHLGASLRDRDVVFERAHVRHRDRHRARLRAQQLGVVGRAGPGDAERELGVVAGSADSGCSRPGLLAGVGRAGRRTRRRRRCRGFGAPALPAPAGSRAGDGFGRPLRAPSSPPRPLPRPLPLRSSRGCRRSPRRRRACAATSTALIAITSRSPRELVGEVRAQGADPQRQAERPHDQHSAHDVERGFALLGRQDWGQLQGQRVHVSARA